MSLVARLMEWLLGPMLFLWMATATVTFVSLHRVLDEAGDERALDTAAHVQILWQHAQYSPTVMRPLLASLSKEGRPHYEIGIFDRQGVEIFATLPGMIELSATPRHGTMQSLVVGQETSSCAISQRDTPRYGTHTVVVCDANSTRALQSALVFQHILLPQSLILLVAVAFVYYGLRYLLNPLVSLRRDLDARAMNNLSAVNVQAALHELEPLLGSINSLMRRLELGFETQSRFIANAAHQLRTPLAGIHTNIELAQRALKSGEVARAEEILQSQIQLSTRTTKLANQLLALARSETALQPTRMQSTSPAQLLANSLGQSARLAQKREVELTYDVVGPTDRWFVEGDPALLEEAIFNVVENAIEHAPPHSEVQCVVDALTRELRIYDSGPGISEAQAESYFQPFVRGAQSRHTGTGLGLAIVREIMRRHGGEARFAVRDVGTGACMVLSFPINVA